MEFKTQESYLRGYSRIQNDPVEINPLFQPNKMKLHIV